MEAMGLIGFMVGGAGMTFALVALGQVANLKNELNELKITLNASGVIKEDSEF